MKKYFITGLIILLPLAVTLGIILFVFNLLTEPFAGIISALFARYHLFENGLLIWSAAQVQNIVSQLMVLLFLGCLTLFLGFLARDFFFSSALKFWDYLVQKIPIISTIYKACKDITQTVFTTDSKSFKQVVMAPYPNKDSYTLGFITNENLSLLPDDPRVAVFIPTTPTPLSGFLFLYNKEDLIYLDMGVDQAFKFVISCGMIASPFSVIHPEEKS